MRSRSALLVVCLLVTAVAATPLSARDLRPPQPASASWLEEMTGWVASLWEKLSGLAGGAEQGPKNLELPPPANGIEEGGETNPGGSCIDPNGPPSCGLSNS
ncbi:MAG TPA: hypothetical protein VEL74_08730 [Thermoanaerobaculia bacterium]|nr:hypothetical protein [Thermoanaerobaculia bacterium]